ncbi:hypothetical protein VAR608DRAFT_4807 [Variovorax sp. HW608]|uniref:hypothetical protein n=1 Tax=Variovorax sp. HW608 TaxID=1034889 RepID=UPI0008201E9A|nr:hypothetical protein [Variovorax sp. HW608]SCK48446.1 hypothetical protein VAR608DRAFT_4807 [Variovorax sp. HW608]
MPTSDRERPIAASRPEPSSTSFWLHLGLVGLTMIFTFVAWCIYVLLGRPAPWNPPAQASAAPATQVHEPVRVFVPVPTPVPAPAPVPVREPALTAAAEPKSGNATQPPAPDTVTQALSLTRRPEASANRSPSSSPASSRQATAGDRIQAASRPAPARTDATTRARRDTRAPEEPIDYPVVVRRPGSQPDPGPPIAPGPGPQYSWTRPATTRVAGDPGPPIAVGPGPRYETRPEVRAPVTAVMPSGDSGPPIAIGPGPRYDYSTPSTPSARER